MPRVIVSIRGGVFQSAVSDSAGVEVMVVDYDDIAAGDEVPKTFEPIPVDSTEFATELGETAT